MTGEHFNYAFLQNQDRHAHLHVIPRYAGERLFAGVAFDDSDYPDHYAVPAPNRKLTQEQTAELVETFADALAGTQNGAGVFCPKCVGDYA